MSKKLYSIQLIIWINWNFCLNSVNYLSTYLGRKYSRKKSQLKTFDELRSFYYHHHKTSFSISDLPPTSTSILLHILRAFFDTHAQISYLKSMNERLDLLMFGYKIENRKLLPKKVIIFILLNVFWDFIAAIFDPPLRVHNIGLSNYRTTSQNHDQRP